MNPFAFPPTIVGTRRRGLAAFGETVFRRTVPGRPAVWVFWSVAALSYSCWAVDPPQVAPRESAGTSPGVPTRTLLLRNGELLSGKLTSDVEFYYLQRAGSGLIRIPRRDVWHLAADRHEAYRYRVQQLETATADEHRDLVAWCLQQALYDEAAQQLQRARDLAPDHPDLSLLAARLARRQRVAGSPSSAARTVTIALTPPPPPQPILSVPPELFQEFTTEIQPLLLNSCATAACHGRAVDGFRLRQPPRQMRMSPALASENLQATLELVDFLQPSHSPLWLISTQPHGPQRERVFGPRQQQQAARLLSWVERVTQVQPLENRSDDPQPGAPPRAREPAATPPDPFAPETFHAKFGRAEPSPTGPAQ